MGCVLSIYDADVPFFHSFTVPRRPPGPYRFNCYSYRHLLKLAHQNIPLSARQTGGLHIRRRSYCHHPWGRRHHDLGRRIKILVSFTYNFSMVIWIPETYPDSISSVCVRQCHPTLPATGGLYHQAMPLLFRLVLGPCQLPHLPCLAGVGHPLLQYISSRTL